MKKKNQYLLLFLIVMFSLLISGTLQADSISIIDDGTGINWNQTINSGELQGAPGSDLNSEYTKTFQLKIIIDDPATDSWSLEVVKSDNLWNNTDFNLYVSATIDGVSYCTDEKITGAKKAIISNYGAGSADVDITYRLVGISAETVMAELYSTQITYTLVSHL